MNLTDPKFKLGAMVYHVTDDQPGVVNAYVVFKDHVLYRVAWSNCNEEEHHEHELTNQSPNWNLLKPERGDD